MDALFVFVAPIAALKINVKVDWSSCHISQKFFTRINHGFSYIEVSLVSWGILKLRATYLVVIKGILISQSYMVELVMPVVCQNQCQYWSGQG